MNHQSLPLVDISLIIIYLLGMIAVGYHFSKKNQNTEQFTKASGSIPGWAIGASIYATFLSSNTFLGVPGKAYSGNWNAFVFSLSMPLAAWVASKYFIPFYRGTGEISAYTNLEKRFGAWARTYAVVCFLLTQLARMGSIFFGIALSLQALTGYSMETIMWVMGICIIIYTVLGGIEAVIWTEVAQAFIKTFGALLILFLIVKDMPEGSRQVIEIGNLKNKFSLGSMNWNFTSSTFWVVLFYGFLINLNNFGMDQNYIQRYHTTTSETEARKSLWMCVWMYIPASLLFFIIGSSLYAYYEVHPELLNQLKLEVVKAKFPNLSSSELLKQAAQLKVEDYGDKVMPHFMVHKIPVGLMGLIISALLSAAMSTISSGMNASATVFSIDIYQRYFVKDISDKSSLRILHTSTVIFGFLGLASGMAMIGVKSILDIWWQLSGLFAAGMLGLFLLGLFSKKATNQVAIIATLIGLVVICWITFSDILPAEYDGLKSHLHKNMSIVLGTVTLFISGVIVTKLMAKNDS